ncbi:MAG TPA: amidohydrolase family protein [Humisphaera sp.]
MPRPHRTALGLAAASLLVLLVARPSPADRVTRSAVPEGLHENTPAVHALVNARVVVAPGSVLPKATIVVRDGVVERVGADVKPPADARVWDLAGRTVYPGFIDGYTELEDAAKKPAAGGGGGEGGGDAGSVELLRPAGGAGYYNSKVAAQVRAAELFKPDAELNKQLRGQGVVARLVAPGKNIVKGTSAAVTTGEGDAGRLILRPDVAMHARLSPERGTPDRVYPNSPMGALALVRQALYDARWYAAAHKAWAADPSVPRPERNDALEALAPVVAGKLPLMVDAPDDLYALRADRLGKEFEVAAIVRGSGFEFHRLPLVAEAKRPVVVPVNFPKPPNVTSPEQAMAVPLDDLMDWDIAPENPARLDKAGVKIALTAHGLKDRGQFLTNVRKAVRRGLPKEAALRALTVAPAELLGIDKTHGTIERGKSASFVVADGDLFGAGKPTVLETWVDGVRYEVTPALTPEPRGDWVVVVELEGAQDHYLAHVAGTPSKLTGEMTDLPEPGQPPAATKPAETQPATSQPTAAPKFELTNLAYSAGRISFTVKGELLGVNGGLVQASATIVGDKWVGRFVTPRGRLMELTAERKAPPPSANDAGDDEKADKADNPADGEKPKGKKPPADPTTRPASYAVNFPFGAYGRPGLPDRPKRVLFRDATVWTSGPRGRLERASVLVVDGKVAEVFAGNVPAPDDDTVDIDCRGKHLTPGIIDCHSHIATDGGINESGRAVTCNVRVGDFIDPDDISIYRQLAGGVTTSNILHGSANPIGGQNQVIKLRWGAGPEQMKFEGAPAGVKFALGENVKQSNWGERFSTRYPQTRLGVEQIVRDRFAAARDYRPATERFAGNNGKGVPPRRDLEMDALLEILDGKRLIHCHSYRQDEILALLRTCEEFGVRIATLQHILEGYKVADAIARHGAGASTFSDWWAYKLEVYDAIPYNGAIMHKAGVLVSFNSDDAELARRLNLEAAKAVKYGGVPEPEALKFVTINPAKQLGIDKRVGSIEPGKDADLVLWSGSPLSTMSRCEQTWVDGRRYFDRDEDRQLRQRDADRRATLIQKALAAGSPAKDDEKEPKERDRWLRYDAFCSHTREGTK